MRHRPGRPLAVLALLAGMAPRPGLSGQIGGEEMARRAAWESFLASAEVVARKQLQGPDSVTSPWVLTLRSSGAEHRAVWKDIDGKPMGIQDSWRYEVAAYRLDKALGLGMVPVTVERAENGRPGSCQFFADGALPLRDKLQNVQGLTPDGLAVWRRGGYLQQAFDNLIGNSDRSQGNILIAPDWRWVLIDHSRAFRTEAAYTKALPFTEKKRPGTEIMRQLPRALVERLRTLDEAAVAAAVGPYLTEKEVRAVMARKILLVAWIDARIARDGEAGFLY
jgi:hypothetical protein